MVVSEVAERVGILTQIIVSPVEDEYFSISWESLVIPSLEVNNISVPSVLPTLPL